MMKLSIKKLTLTALTSTFLLVGCSKTDINKALDIMDNLTTQTEESSSGEFVSANNSGETVTPDNFSIELSDTTLNGADVVNLPALADGEFYYVVNDNVPNFTDEQLIDTTNWEDYKELDELGRQTGAEANISAEMMPADDEDRESISGIKPSGWNQNSRGDAISDVVNGGWLYERSHLIGHQLVGNIEDDLNQRNSYIVNNDFDTVSELKERALMTGTEWLNADGGNGMIAIENYVADYLENNDTNHIHYRVTPIFNEDESLARGVQMEGFSIEDNGKVQFNVYIPNIQPNVAIDYQTGASEVAK